MQVGLGDFLMRGWVRLLGAVGAVASLTAPAAAETVSYRYDSFGRLIQVIYPDGKQITYAYDSAGNRTQNTTNAAGNSAPTAGDDTLKAAKNTARTFDPRVNDADDDGDTLTITATTAPSHGGVAISGGATTLTYTPTTGYTGPDSFTYTVSDGAGGTDVAAVSVTVGQGPLAVNDSVSTPKNQVITFDPRVNDTTLDGYALSIASVSTPAHGSLAINSGVALTYTPVNNYAGADSFTYTVSDGNGGSSTATVSMRVSGPPKATNDAKTAQENTPYTFDPRTNDSDPNGDPITILSATGGANGTVVVNSGSTLTYTPQANYRGGDTFTYTITDGLDGSATATVTMTVNGKPFAGTDVKSTTKNVALTFDPRVNDTDPDANPLTISAKTNGAHGTVAIVGGAQLTFTPATNYVGTDSFTYTISDGKGGTAVGTVQMTIVGGAEPPNAVDDADEIITVPGAPLQSLTVVVLNNDSDPNNDPLTITAVSTPTNSASAAINGSVIDVTGIRMGTTTFTYTISDGNGGSDTATVTITRTLEDDGNNLLTQPPEEPPLEE